MNEHLDFEQRLRALRLRSPQEGEADMLYRCGYEAARAELIDAARPRMRLRHFWGGLASGVAASVLAVAAWQTALQPDPGRQQTVAPRGAESPLGQDTAASESPGAAEADLLPSAEASERFSSVAALSLTGVETAALSPAAQQQWHWVVRQAHQARTPDDALTTDGPQVEPQLLQPRPLRQELFDDLL